VFVTFWIAILYRVLMLSTPQLILRLKILPSAQTTQLSHECHFKLFILYSASHLRVAPVNVGLQKEQKCNTFAFIPVMKCGCVFWEFAKRKLATRKDKIKVIKSLPLALSVSREERCEVLACHQTVQQTSSGNS
jgi:hypothetical protein